jgi:hypothetical protein
VLLQNGIEFTVKWSDTDVSELWVRCSNGVFSGGANIYLTHDGLSEMARTLTGFPSGIADSRSVELGTFDPTYAGGGIRMHFYCRDSAGHAVVEVKLRRNGCAALGEVESVALSILVEAAAIDSFLDQVRAMNTQKIGATAFLDMAR